MAESRPRIVCVTPVRHEAWILDVFPQAAAVWTDDIWQPAMHAPAGTAITRGW